MKFIRGIWRRDYELELITPAPRFEGRISWELGKFTDGQNYVRESSRGDFRNMIVDTGLDSMNNTNIGSLTNRIAVGTGSTAPAAGQTSMVAEIARTNRRTTGDNVAASGTSFSYWSVKFVYLFIEAEANGNLTEVGFFRDAIGGPMFSRQLFKDVTGTPTTVVKTINDQLKVTYEFRCYPPTVDTTQTGLVISTVSYNITTRARSINSDITWGYNPLNGGGFTLNVGSIWNSTVGGRAFDGTAGLGTTSGGLSGASDPADTAVVGAYSSGNFYRDVTMKWEPGTANYPSGIGGIHSHGGSTTELFQSVFTPVFSKDATKRLTLVVRCAWARYP